MFDGNQFTGALPTKLFGIESLDLFTASINCLHGTIPESVCDSPLLNEFALDGASSASACQTSLFPESFGFKTYSLRNHRITGTIPSCLFNMPNIHLLHLSGNEMTGSLSSDLQLSESLEILVLSHNQLSGDIPKAIQTHPWETLDLSYNRLSGTLSHFKKHLNSTLNLEVNRLSGNICTIRSCQGGKHQHPRRQHFCLWLCWTGITSERYRPK